MIGPHNGLESFPRAWKRPMGRGAHAEAAAGRLAWSPG